MLSQRFVTLCVIKDWLLDDEDFRFDSFEDKDKDKDLSSEDEDKDLRLEDKERN